MKPILAILVLYRMQLAESSTYRTLQSCCQEDPALVAAFDLMVADNSPQPQALPGVFVGDYIQDGANPGLARRYNQALQRASEGTSQWLLLLDQDTNLTIQYLRELVEMSHQLTAHEEIAAIVPKLVQKSQMLSPHLPPYRKSTYQLDLSTYGPIPGPVKIYNSGSLVRVKALHKIGGFPEAYPLDYLDHATFQQIEKQGGRFFLMHACLEHELSTSDPDRYKKPGYAARRAQKLSAELRFYREFGTFRELRLHRMDLAREAGKALRCGRFAEARRLLWGVLSWPGAL